MPPKRFSVHESLTLNGIYFYVLALWMPRRSGNAPAFHSALRLGVGCPEIILADCPARETANRLARPAPPLVHDSDPVTRPRPAQIRAGVLRHRAARCDWCLSSPARTAFGLRKVLFREAPAIEPGYKSSLRADNSTDTGPTPTVRSSGRIYAK